MNSFFYNDTEFTLEPAGAAWEVRRRLPGGADAPVGTGLFPGAAAAEAGARARALVAAIRPVGVALVGPDVAHPALVGDLRIVGPNVAHPNFIHWDKDSSSFPKQA